MNCKHNQRPPNMCDGTTALSVPYVIYYSTTVQYLLDINRQARVERPFGLGDDPSDRLCVQRLGRRFHFRSISRSTRQPHPSPHHPRFPSGIDHTLIQQLLVLLPPTLHDPRSHGFIIDHSHRPPPDRGRTSPASSARCS